MPTAVQTAQQRYLATKRGKRAQRAAEQRYRARRQARRLETVDIETEELTT